MEKITERLLLEKGSPQTNKLQHITNINLSRLGLKNKDLPVALLNKLTSLQVLDLSGNMLQKLPAALSFPRLRVLNLSSNDLEDVHSLESLSNLEELRLEDNLYLTVSDEHRVMFLLPKLKILNGKDVSSTANHIRYVSSEILRKRVIGVWEKDFSLPETQTTQGLDTLEKKFVAAACFRVKYGPSSLNDYTKWRVEMIAKEYLKSLTNPDQEEEGRTTEHDDTVQSPSKRKSSDPDANVEAESPRKRRTLNEAAAPEASPRKSTRQASSASLEASPRKSSRLQDVPKSSPMKSVKAPAPEASPRKSSRVPVPSQKFDATASPRKSAQAAGNSSTGKKNLQDQLTTQNAGKPTRTGHGSLRKAANYQVPQEPASLQPLHVLQCHSKNDSPDDFSTQLWACAFEPVQDNSDDASAPTVATCGGETVCVIDCESGHVLKKYKVPGEEFFTVAWTTVLMAREHGTARPCSVLAAGGKRGMVKLIHPRANLAYGEFRASRRAISIMRFYTSFLFTGTYDNKIIMWDIGGLDRDYNYTASQLLVLETRSSPLHLCLPPSSPDTHLLSACDDGLYSFNIQLGKNVKKRMEEMEIIFPVYKRKDKTNDYRTIDGLSFLTDDLVASKSHMQGSIYLWSWKGTRAMHQGKKKEVAAVILAELQWAKTDIPYLSLNTCPGFGYVVCGDEKGRLWTYHVTDAAKAAFKSGKAIPATEVLEWPSPVRKGTGPVEGPSINNVCMDPKLRYLVALSDKNMVVVWKQGSQP
ncbi:leucine-rich repeat and WD repeat-containing protein 1 [Trichomycterus rosablanca]|uniref:leucine-rich repeat and WD repeat-containing protein 1 n=1 Tax=Trichomycterus rosablanca TaxID=2290929 RepID=UPI002F358AF1